MATWKIEHNDVIEWAKTYDGPPAHAMFCDAPYHLVSTVKRFSKPNSKPPKEGVYRRASGGMMNQVWDGLGESGKGISFDPATWEALAEHLYPGAFGMTFASPRTHHRIACAIEDAGLIIQPEIYGLCYLSGFPKATRIDTQIDKAAGIEIERGKAHPAFAPRGVGYRSDEFANNGHEDGGKHKAQSPLARDWAGHRYGGQALKPMLEPLICFQKPYEGRPVDCIVKTGAGALNIDGSRIPTNGETPKGSGNRDSWRRMEGRTDRQDYHPTGTPEAGRWPGNLYLHHTYFPVMRLTGHQPSGIISEIRRYFYGYTRVSELRQRGRSTPTETRRRPEVLQPSMQEQGNGNQARTDQGNTEVSILPGGILDSSILGTSGAAKVLQSQMQKPVSEAVDGGDVKEIRDTPHHRIQGEDFTKETGDGPGEIKASSLEGGGDTYGTVTFT